METLIGIIGEILLDVVQELWPPILGIVDGLLVLVFAFLTWLFFTTGQPVKGRSACWPPWCFWRRASCGSKAAPISAARPSPPAASAAEAGRLFLRMFFYKELS